MLSLMYVGCDYTSGCRTTSRYSEMCSVGQLQAETTGRPGLFTTYFGQQVKRRLLWLVFDEKFGCEKKSRLFEFLIVRGVVKLYICLFDVKVSIPHNNSTSFVSRSQ